MSNCIFGGSDAVKCWLCGTLVTIATGRVLLGGIVVHRSCDKDIKRRKNISSGASKWRTRIQKELNAKS